MVMNSFAIRTVVRQDRIQMYVDRIEDARQQFARDVLDIRMALPRQLSHIRPSEATDRTVERWKMINLYRFYRIENK